MPLPIAAIGTGIAAVLKKIGPNIILETVRNRTRNPKPQPEFAERLRRLENKIDSIDRRLARLEGSLGIHPPESP